MAEPSECLAECSSGRKGPPGLNPDPAILRAPEQPSSDASLCAPGLSFCQLHKQRILLGSYINSTDALYLPQCQDSGNYAPVQCDLQRVQCWCVDTEGMEVYGTRQQGRPTRCKYHCHRH